MTIESRRKTQNWILDRFIGGMGLDALFPGYTGFATSPVIGANISDFEQIKRETVGAGTMRQAYVRAGERRQALAAEAEEAGHLVTARRHFHQAAICFSYAQYMIQRDHSERKLELHARSQDCYAKVREYAATPIEKIEIPFQDEEPFSGDSLPGLLHLPPGEGPFPCIVFLPGTDMWKELIPNAEDNIFAKRGIACLSLDGPGQGESLLRMLKVKVETWNYERAVSAALDYLDSRPEIDASKLAVMGASTGSYWATRAAYYEAERDDRIRAVAGIHAQWETGFVTEFEHSQPNFKTNYMYMAGVDDEAEFDRQASLHQLDGLVADVRCPVLLVHGEFDEVCTPEQLEEIISQMSQPHELRIYESEYHPLGNVMLEAYEKAIDWVHDRLQGVPLDGGTVRVIAEGRTASVRATGAVGVGS